MMDEQLRDNVELLLRGKSEAPSPEFLRRMDALLRPRESSEPGRRYFLFTAFAAAAAFALILWIAQLESQPSVSGPQDVAVVKGTVTLKGLPPPRRTSSTKGLRGGGAAVELYPDGIVFDPVPINAAGRVQGCLVFVLNGLEGKSFAPPKEPKKIAFDRYHITPRMMGIMVGQDLVVENRDPDVHNARFSPHHNKETNDVLGGAGTSIRRHFEEPERGIKMRCDLAHFGDRGYMAVGWVTVLPHPFYSVTDDQGHFEIQGLPPGKYTIEVWQEYCVPSLKVIEVKPGQPSVLDLTLEVRPPNVNRVWNYSPEDQAFISLKEKAIEVDGRLDLSAAVSPRGNRKAVILRSQKMTALCILAPGVEEQLKDFPHEALVTFRGIFKGRVESESAHFVMEDCRISEAMGQKFWK